MNRMWLLAGTIAATVSAAAAAAPRHRADHSTGPVPQSAEIAALNRQSLAKIGDLPAPAPAPAPAETKKHKRAR